MLWESKTFLESGFSIPGTRFRNSLSVEPGLRIRIVSGIPDSKTKNLPGYGVGNQVKNLVLYWRLNNWLLVLSIKPTAPVLSEKKEKVLAMEIQSNCGY